MPAPSLIIAQISDLHVTAAGRMCNGIVDTAGALERCIDQLLAHKTRPDLLLVTGDLAESGSPQEYARLRRLFARLPMPCFPIPGNHDDRDRLREGFRDLACLRQWAPYLQYAVDDWPLRIVALDTVIAGEPGGRLCDERLAWLGQTLAAEPRKPTLIMMHHPPFHTGIGHMDAMALEQPGRFAAVLQRHAQVERIVCGHLHRTIEARFAGIPVSTCPSPAHQVAFDLEADAPARFIMEPPGYRMMIWSAADGLVSHLVPIGDFPGPYPFTD